jgi:hypothetical protein
MREAELPVNMQQSIGSGLNRTSYALPFNLVLRVEHSHNCGIGRPSGPSHGAGRAHGELFQEQASKLLL